MVSGCPIAAMPEMDGVQAYRVLRQLAPRLKVIMSSGYNQVEVVQKFIGEGLAGFNQKPYSFAELKELLYLVLGRPGSST